MMREAMCDSDVSAPMSLSTTADSSIPQDSSLPLAPFRLQTCTGVNQDNPKQYDKPNTQLESSIISVAVAKGKVISNTGFYPSDTTQQHNTGENYYFLFTNVWPTEQVI